MKMSKELEYIEEVIKCFKEALEENRVDGFATEQEAKEYLQTLENIKSKLNRIEAIDNANPSEALKSLHTIAFNTQFIAGMNFGDELRTIEKALLKAQEPKKYLKWEDLEFKKEEQTMKVTLNGKEYILKYKKLKDCDVDRVRIMDNYFYKYMMLYTSTKQFFNDLHLERVEE